MNIVAKRLELLRNKMDEVKADWYFITSDDFHTSEYVADYFNVRNYYTGFHGENAFLVLNKTNAYMWTDGRFFIQAEKELEGSGIELMRMGEENVPKVSDFICDNVKNGETLYFDGRTVSTDLGAKIEKKLKEKSAKIVVDKDIAGDLWTERPSLPSEKIWILSDEEAGESVDSKLSRVRKEMEKNNCDGFFLAKLDDIMWLTNLRGNDIAFNPVALSYMFVTKDEAFIFLLEDELSSEVEDKLSKENIQIKDYNSILAFLSSLNGYKNILLEESAVNFACYKVLSSKASIVNERNCTTNFKAVKNETELQRLKEINILDSVAVTKFMYWLKTNIGKMPISELSAADKIDGLRKEIEGFVELSFPTISGYGPNAAMMHYSATEESYSDCKAEGMLLVDSGGQYKKGTTDVTRTFVLGEISDEIKKHFSKVAAGMLALADATFLYGCTGRNLDILARLPLWEIGIDYKCGTGHGVGYILNVHEGPHGLRWMYNPSVKEAILEAGMIVSDEPGVYIENSHGIRTENVIAVVKKEKNSDGQFMGFEHLTYVPIDRDGIDKKYLSLKDIERIDNYHKAVYDKLSSYMTAQEKEWLKDITRPL